MTGNRSLFNNNNNKMDRQWRKITTTSYNYTFVCKAGFTFHEFNCKALTGLRHKEHLPYTLDMQL